MCFEVIINYILLLLFINIEKKISSVKEGMLNYMAIK